MVARVTNNFRLFQAKSMVDGLRDTDQNDIFYLFTGHSTAIDDDSENDQIPPVPGIGYTDLVVNYDTMISMSRILVGGIGRVIRRYNWVTNSFYRPYHTHGELHDIGESDQSINGPLAGFPYYVVNTDTSTGTPRLNVYKCLYAPYDVEEDGFIQSTVAPTGTDINPFTTSDNYTWKFLYTIAPSESLVFNTSDWMFAAERIDADDRANITTGSIRQRQLNVQDNAVKGEVWSISVLNAGSGLRDGTYPVTIDNGTFRSPSRVFVGDAIVADSELKIITTETSGRGYEGIATVTFGSATTRDSDQSISDSESVLPTVHVNIADGEGHGSNIPAELNATTVMMNARIIHEAGQNEFMTQNDFRQIGVIRNPVDASTNIQAVRDHYRLTYYLDVSSPIADLTNDDIINNGESDGARARVVGLGSSLDSENVSRGFGTRVFYTLLDQTENFSAEGNVRREGDGSITLHPIISVSDPEIIYDSGDILYVENRKPINRATDQIESYNIVFGF